MAEQDDLQRYISERGERDQMFAEEYRQLEPEYDIAATIMRARIGAGLTQEELARRSGMKASNISRLETGNSMPTVRTLTQLAKAMGKRLSIEFV